MGRRFARGRKARAICQRSGFEIPYKYLVKEPGTGLLVDRRWSDGMWNRVDHPVNFPARDLVDELPLRWATGNTDKVPETTRGTLFEVSLPGGVGLQVEEFYPSVTVISLSDEQGRIIVDETSAEITDTFSYLFYNSYQRID